MTDPQHVILAQELIARIKAGEFRVGDKLPTELELCESRSLARGTVRQALKHLEDAGLISRRRGAGTTVAAPAPADGYEAFVSTRAEMLAFVQRTRIRDPITNIVAADDHLARRIGVPPDSEWYCVSGVRELLGSPIEPFCWSELYLRADLPYRRMLLTGRFDMANLVRQRISQEVVADTVSAAVSSALGVEKGSAALVVVHRYFSSGDAMDAVAIHTHPAGRYRVATSVGSSGDRL
ncbi:GntR family transcriptional regulator [Rhodococcus sp. SGAir0479]|uniref:GntR family transcriptional regulator n=1 Tax=Rhodococcus sp. SGAir0479 TaxID=2567884 RepID=UPI0010CD2244|nr:GntR family transcriptional regulator [Rhodococcus sp. SGAir0479]QCQ92742.1 GntR family transcriptional regulator [Rhodococcus sp. SGAir0479]